MGALAERARPENEEKYSGERENYQRGIVEPLGHGGTLAGGIG